MRGERVLAGMVRGRDIYGLRRLFRKAREVYSGSYRAKYLGAFGPENTPLARIRKGQRFRTARSKKKDITQYFFFFPRASGLRPNQKIFILAKLITLMNK